jgi:hypothetical protein
MKKYLKIILGVFAVTFIISLVSGGPTDKAVSETSPEPTETTTTSSDEQQPVAETLTLTGIERDENSDAFGELVAPEISLWEKSGADGQQRGKVVGKAKHQDVVQVLEVDEGTDITFYKVRLTDEIEGWVSQLFVEIE